MSSTLLCTAANKSKNTGNSAYTLYYYYDAAGSIAGFEYNGTTYYFQKNLQGDIIRICNIAGNTVVEYTYDAWGKVTSMTGTLASTVGQANPFRYRGYYYDSETGLYYLQTRYYDPEIGRFLNADGYIGANGDIPGYNMFAYCSNNPAIRIDPNGDFWWIIPLIIIIPLTVTGCSDSSSNPKPIVEVKPAPIVEIKPMPKCPTEVIELLIESNKKKIVELSYEGHITEDGFDVYFFYDKPFNLRFRYAVYVKTHNETYKEYYNRIARNYTTMKRIFSYIDSGTFSTGILWVDGIIGIADVIGHFGGKYFDGRASKYYHLSYNASNRIRITIDHIICYFMANDKVLDSWYD